VPYIKRELREPLDPHINRLVDAISTEGELNYVVSRLALGFAQTNALGDQPAYCDWQAAAMTLVMAMLELYRTRIGPYEDLKRAENGDVSDTTTGGW
jgi:hypothetical protein